MISEIRQRMEQIKNDEVPEGYVHTKAGILPKWECAHLSQIAEAITDKVGNGTYETLSISAGIGFVNQAKKFGKELSGKQYEKYTVLKRGDFSYNKGNSKTYPQGCIYRLKDRETAAVPNVFESFTVENGNSDYYEQLFISGFLNKQLSTKINHGVRDDGLLNLTEKDFYSCYVPVPSLKEQQKIAEILMQCDKVIELKTKRIEEEIKLERWLMENLLNPDSGIRLQGFNDEWCMESLYNRVEYIRNGYVYDALHQGGNCKVTRIETISDGNVNTNAVATVEYKDDMNQYRLKKYDILYSHINSFEQLGKSAIFCGEEELYHGMNLLCIRTNQNVCRPYFLYYLLKSTQGTKMVNAYAKRAIGQCSISAREILQHKFYFPNTLEEQIAIENVLMVQDRKIKLLDSEFNQWQQKKKGLMQLLLTGIVRCI